MKELFIIQIMRLISISHAKLLLIISSNIVKSRVNLLFNILKKEILKIIESQGQIWLNIKVQSFPPL